GGFAEWQDVLINRWLLRFASAAIGRCATALATLGHLTRDFVAGAGEALSRERAVEVDLLGDHLADPAHALADLGLVDAGEVEPHRVATAAFVDVGRLARDEGDVVAQRPRQQVAGVDEPRQGRPYEETALRFGPARPG